MGTAPTWREIARPIIRRTIAEHAGADERELRRHLRDAYPFGERAYHPYKTWCDEVAKQLAAHFRPLPTAAHDQDNLPFSLEA